MEENYRSRLWWYGLFLVVIGFMLWILSLFDYSLVNVIGLLSSNPLIEITEIGLLAYKFALGFGSAATIGWGFAILASSVHYTKKVKDYIMLGIVIWYILDGISSFVSGFYLNIVSNTFFLISGLYVLNTTDLSE